MELPTAVHEDTSLTALTATESANDTSNANARQVKSNKHQQSGNKKLFGCELCGREFLYLASLRAHRRQHARDKLHYCRKCGKSFKWFSVFSKHDCVQAPSTVATAASVTERISADKSSRQVANKVKVKSEPMEGESAVALSLRNDSKHHHANNERKRDLQHHHHTQPQQRRQQLQGAEVDFNASERRQFYANGDRNLSVRPSPSSIRDNSGLKFSSRPGLDCNRKRPIANQRNSGNSEAARNSVAEGQEGLLDMPQPIAVGSGDKWSCPICGNVYKSLYFVKNHMRIVHAGMKRYSCPLCDKRFGYSNVLRDHMRLHEMHGMVLPPSPSSHQQQPMSAGVPPPPPLTHNPLPLITHNPLHMSPRDWLPPRHHSPTGWPGGGPPPRWVTPSGFPGGPQAPPPPPLWPNLAWPSASVENPLWDAHPLAPPPHHLFPPAPGAWLGKDIPPMPGVGMNPSSSNGLFRDSLAGRGLFPCRGCAEVFDSQASLVAHAELRHKSPPAASSASISAAAAAELADKSFFVCGTDDCPEVFDNAEELRDHRQQSHSAVTGERKSYACTYCSRVLYSYGGWKLHEMIHRGEKPLKCKYCPYNARSAANMHSHVQTRHKSRTSSTGNNVR
ncbi:MAG: C2H2-type zinc finger protein [Candidatus Kapabacteria bacterium]|nr:C2H2-type zinc finger protein [Candidatus Kapabacteria bacterium]